MADMILFLGGTRSGKSTRAEAEAMKAEGAVVYVATAKARPEDSSLQERIRRHQVRRPGHWHTLECPKGLAGGLEALLADIPDDGHPVTILIDCVTMWMANILFSLPDPEDLVALETAARQEVEELLALMKFMVNHNDAHAQELAELASQLQTAGKARAYRRIMNAVADFDMVNAQLDSVVKDLSEDMF